MRKAVDTPISMNYQVLYSILSFNSNSGKSYFLISTQLLHGRQKNTYMKLCIGFSKILDYSLRYTVFEHKLCRSNKNLAI